jgi:hypothetical protein
VAIAGLVRQADTGAFAPQPSHVTQPPLDALLARHPQIPSRWAAIAEVPQPAQVAAAASLATQRASLASLERSKRLMPAADNTRDSADNSLDSAGTRNTVTNLTEGSTDAQNDEEDYSMDMRNQAIADGAARTAFYSALFACDNVSVCASGHSAEEHFSQAVTPLCDSQVNNTVTHARM